MNLTMAQKYDREMVQPLSEIHKYLSEIHENKIII
jgi:hypothetical protein